MYTFLTMSHLLNSPRVSLEICFKIETLQTVFFVIWGDLVMLVLVDSMLNLFQI